MKTILLAVREAEAYDSDLLPKFTRLARALDARVELLTVTTPLIYDSVGMNGELVADAQRALVQRATAALDAMAEKLRSAGITVRVSVEVDIRAYEAIARRAGQLHPDLVVVGCHSPHRFASLLKYTDWELVRLCPAPLLLVKDPAPWTTGRVLAAIDPEHAFDKPADLDRLILGQAARLCASLDGDLHLVHSLPVPALYSLPGLPAAPDVLAALRGDAESRARQACEKVILEAGVVARLHLSNEVPSQAIPHVASECAAEIVVMGAISRSLLQRWILGDTALKVLDQVRADVLIVKPSRP